MNMKTYKMQPEELELLQKVKNYTSIEKLSIFFNRSETTIRDNIYRLHNKRPKYVYYKPKLRFSKQPFNGQLSK